MKSEHLGSSFDDFLEEEGLLAEVEEKSLTLLRPRSGKSILRHTGTWKGEDFEGCLKTVYDNRSEIEFV